MPAHIRRTLFQKKYISIYKKISDNKGISEIREILCAISRIIPYTKKNKRQFAKISINYRWYNIDIITICIFVV